MLPKTAEYALRAVVWLAREPGRPASADHLAEHTKVPRRYLHKVLQDLVRAGLVCSQPGPGGGYGAGGVAGEGHDSGRGQRCSSAGANSQLPARASHRIRGYVHCIANWTKFTRRLRKRWRVWQLAHLLCSTSSIVPLCEVK